MDKNVKKAIWISILIQLLLFAGMIILPTMLQHIVSDKTAYYSSCVMIQAAFFLVCIASSNAITEAIHFATMFDEDKKEISDKPSIVIWAIGMLGITYFYASKLNVTIMTMLLFGSVVGFLLAGVIFILFLLWMAIDYARNK